MILFQHASSVSQCCIDRGAAERVPIFSCRAVCCVCHPDAFSRATSVEAALAFCHTPHVVSILTRPCDRVQRHVGDTTPVHGLFQSSPGLATGCNAHKSRPCLRTCAFQSSPGLATGCNLAGRVVALRQPASGFNPHPALRPGATARIGRDSAFPRKFQSSPGLATGCNLETVRTRCTVFLFQSSPGLATGCNPSGSRPALRLRSRFQSSPGLATGCNEGGAADGLHTGEVSILTRPCDRVQHCFSIALSAW